MITVSQMVRALNSDQHCKLASWEREAIHWAHVRSCHGLKPYHLTLRECQLIMTIFNREYDYHA